MFAFSNSLALNGPGMDKIIMIMIAITSLHSRGHHNHPNNSNNNNHHIACQLPPPPPPLQPFCFRLLKLLWAIMISMDKQTLNTKIYPSVLKCTELLSMFNKIKSRCVQVTKSYFTTIFHNAENEFIHKSNQCKIVA